MIFNVRVRGRFPRGKDHASMRVRGVLRALAVWLLHDTSLQGWRGRMIWRITR
jgi:hypothetical protein